MAIRATSFLRLGLVVCALGACSEDPENSFPPESDASAEDTSSPMFDVPTDLGTSTTDRGTTDRGNTTERPPAVDRGGGDCPASCTTSAQCDPCRTADTPDSVQYCCISGLCVSMTGSCTVSGDVPTGDTSSDASEGGAPDSSGIGDDAPDLDDVPEDDTGEPPPVDAGSDAGTSTPADAATDAGSSMDAAAAADAGMDASTGG